VPTAVVRVEQLYPWPATRISAILDRYSGASEVVWLQEEPENMGAGSFVRGRLEPPGAKGATVRHVSRTESGSPATGSHLIHELEHEDLLARAIGSLAAQ
jgi:2-oxoglutarate dehydrogenase E1 component